MIVNVNHRSRLARGLPHFVIRWDGNLLNSTLCYKPTSPSLIRPPEKGEFIRYAEWRVFLIWANGIFLRMHGECVGLHRNAATFRWDRASMADSKHVRWITWRRGARSVVKVYVKEPRFSSGGIFVRVLFRNYKWRKLNELIWTSQIEKNQKISKKEHLSWLNFRLCLEALGKIS